MVVDGLKHSMLEDMYHLSVYKDMFNTMYGVTVVDGPMQGERWGDYVDRILKSCGKLIIQGDRDKQKKVMAEYAARQPKDAFDARRRGPLDSLVTALASKVKSGERT